MYVGTQIEPRDDSDYRVWAQLGVIHVCVDPPGSPHYWSLDALRRHKDHVESFGLSLDMVQLPIPSGPIEAQDRASLTRWAEGCASSFDQPQAPRKGAIPTFAERLLSGLMYRRWGIFRRSRSDRAGWRASGTCAGAP
jgi:hypothetical protein